MIAHGGMFQMSRGVVAASTMGALTPRRAALLKCRRINRVTTIHPKETTTSRTHATVRIGSRKNSANDGSAATGGNSAAITFMVEHGYHFSLTSCKSLA